MEIRNLLQMPILLSHRKAGLKSGLYKVFRRALNLPRFAKRSYGEEHEQEADGDCDTNEPMSGVARPSAQRGVEPTKSKNGKDRPNDLVKELPKHAPEPPESSLLRSCGS